MRSPFKNIRLGDLIVPVSGLRGSLFVVGFDLTLREKVFWVKWLNLQDKRIGGTSLVLGRCGNAKYDMEGAVFPNPKHYVVWHLEDE